MSTRRRKDDDDKRYKLLREMIEPCEMAITKEERLRLRNIPFFVLPSHETVPRTDHIGPKVSTRNTSYSPARVKPPTSLVRTKVPDYSHVKAKVYTGRRSSETSLPEQGSVTRTVKVYHSSPSLHRTAPVLPFKSAASTSRLPFRSASKHRAVESRVNSLSTAKSQSARASKVETINSKAQVTAGRSSHKSSPLDHRTRPNTPKKEVHSRVDHSDPNPAHQLRHTLEELELPNATKVNPRFAETKKRNKISRSFSSSELQQIKAEQRKQDPQKLRKRATLSVLEHSQLTRPSSLKKAQRQSPPTTSQSEGEEMSSNESTVQVLASTDHNDESSEQVVTRCDIIEDSCSNNALGSISEDKEMWAQSFEVSHTDTGTTVFLKNILANANLRKESDVTDNKHDLTVMDIEVSNTETDTTVFLSNILARSSLTKENDPSLDTINEDEEEVSYYEVALDDAPLIAESSAHFPHGIPRLCVLDENEEVSEVVVDPPQSSSTSHSGIPVDDNEPSTRL